MEVSEDFYDLLPKVRKAWGADTSADPQGWTAENPSWGQSEITAVLLQERMGGKILQGRYITPSGKVGMHVWNDFDGSAFDATSQQYPKGTQIVKSKKVIARQALLQDPVTASRFRQMKARV